MPRKIRGGWVWDEARVQKLAELLRRRLSAAKIAAALNQEFEVQLTKGHIEAALRYKTVRALLRLIAEDAEELVASYRDRTGKMGRPRGSRDTAPRPPKPKPALPQRRVGINPLDSKTAAKRLLALRIHN